MSEYQSIDLNSWERMQHCQIFRNYANARYSISFTGPLGNDIYQFSAIPWISFTHISHTDSGKKENAVPMFDWGKWYQEDEKKWMPFSIEAHHSFVDGIHMGKMAERLQAYLDQVEML